MAKKKVQLTAELMEQAAEALSEPLQEVQELLEMVGKLGVEGVRPEALEGLARRLCAFSRDASDLAQKLIWGAQHERRMGKVKEKLGEKS